MKVGVISDTHGTVHKAVFDVFNGAEHILHAGDIGDEDIIVELETIAPVTAVHGNVDHFPISSRYPSHQIVELNGYKILLYHIPAFPKERWQDQLSKPGLAKDIRVIVNGHTHMGEIDWQDQVMFLNPGSAKKGRHGAPRSVAILELPDKGWPAATIIKIE